ncbi:MAG: DUF2867 domain-containing protein [Herminiimonas sp.]|nr:DUF2867 domain-containing protein [Herminiimonas sp.]
MTSEFNSVVSVAIPPRSGIAHIYKSLNLSDAFSICLPPGACGNPEVLARFILSHQPAWISWLMKIRDMMVLGFGLKTATQLATLAADGNTDRMGIFKIYSRNEMEIIVGEDDKHLNFRISILCLTGTTPKSNRRVVVSTVVHCHNRLGRAYIFVIAPFHRMVVRSGLFRAARAGWPIAPSR